MTTMNEGIRTISGIRFLMAEITTLEHISTNIDVYKRQALYNIIVHHHDKHLHKPDETTGSGTSLRVLAIPVRHTQNDEKQQ